jgi:hypothetical protein
MGNVTFRLLPRFIRREQPTITDGEAELAVTYQVHELLKKLPAKSQRRCLEHVADILEENEHQRAVLAAALEQQNATNDRQAG